MNHISKPLTSSKVKSYYKTEYSAASNSYYSNGAQLEGHWQGKAGETFGLSGAVTEEAFNRLAEGQHPVTGAQLIKHRDTIKTQAGEEIGHRAGWDLTYNAPKTISLTAIVGEDERVRHAHQRAVTVALDATEKYIQARMGGVKLPENTANMIVAKFEHDTARPVNGYSAPHLHTHAVLFNMTSDQHGQVRSLQPHELFRIQSYSTAVYQNELEHGLRKLGYGIERGTNHAPEIKGYSPEYLAAESLRGAQIKSAMEERGLTGREANGRIAHENREAKLKLSPSELRAANQASAEAFGNQPQAVVAEARGHTHKRELAPEKVQAIAEKAVTSARESLSERSSVFEHFEVLRDALRHVHGKVQLRDIEQELAKQKIEQKFTEVQHIRPSAPEYRYTTPELVATERAVLDRIRAGKNQVDPLPNAKHSIILKRFDNLNAGQRTVVYEALSTRDQISAVQGRAGSGKSTALSAVAELAEESGYKVQGLAPTSKAVKGLRDAGMDAMTLALHSQERREREDSKPRFYFVDESSLVASKGMREFLEKSHPQDRVLLIGDVKQHQSIEAGRIFGQLQESGMKVSELNEIVRQKDLGLKQVVEHMAAGQTAEGVALLQEQGRVHSILNRNERIAAIGAEYLRLSNSPKEDGTKREVLIISPDNASRRELNNSVREQLREAHQLGPDKFKVEVLVPKQQITAEGRKQAESYEPGDSVRYLRGSKALGFEPKSYARVITHDEGSNTVTVRTEGGKAITYNPARLPGVVLYSPETRSFAEGDRVQFTAPWREQGVATRDMGVITQLDKSGNVRVSMDEHDGKSQTVSFNLERMKHVEHGYAMTSHSTESVTVDNMLLHVDTGDSKNRALIDQALGYVALSRPRHGAEVFTDDADQLSKALSRKNENATALAPEETIKYEPRTPKREIAVSYGMGF